MSTSARRVARGHRRRNLRFIPKGVRAALGRLAGRQVVAGCAITFDADAITRGELAHLNVSLDAAGLHIPDGIIPPVGSGRFSAANRLGAELVRKDLPLETHYNYVDTPNWGDASTYGSHTVALPYEKYPREFIAPRGVEIRMSCPTLEPNRSRYLVKFELSEVLDQESATFEGRLLAGLNILQENLGHHGVARSGAALSEYIASLRVSWEVLPPATLDETIARIFRGRPVSREVVETVTDRYRFLLGLHPTNFVCGTSGFARYFGAQFSEDFVAFENVAYGNAIYLMFDDWRLLSQRTRVELLSGQFGDEFVRVVHSPGWKDKVRSIVGDRLAR